MEREDYYIFYIQDNGIGIPKKDFKKIFKVFQTSNETGTGIGLSIVKKIIESKNEKIWLESTENVGTTFFFTYQKNRL
jgi:signal transduction histidine kinase